MRRKDVWKLVVVVALLAVLFPVAPEISMLAALIDVVGLDLLLFLFEVQLIVAIAAVYKQRIMPIVIWINAQFEMLDPIYFVPSRAQAKSCPAAMVHAVPCLAGLTFLTVAVLTIYA